jgi:hypothetical protein
LLAFYQENFLAFWRIINKYRIHVDTSSLVDDVEMRAQQLHAKLPEGEKFQKRESKLSFSEYHSFR